MSIQSEIDRLKVNVLNSFSECRAKDAIMPAEQTSDTLSNCIKSIKVPDKDLLIIEVPGITEEIIKNVFEYKNIKLRKPYPDYLYIEALEDTDIGLIKKGSISTTPTIKYSFDKETWEDYTVGTYIELEQGEKVYFKGNNTQFSSGYSSSITFASTSTGQVKAGGDIMSLVNEEIESSTVPSSYFFASLFYGLTNLVDIMDLKITATTLTESCFMDMFWNCTGLTEFPDTLFIATNLGSGSYSYMFEGCKNIKVSQTRTGYYQKPFRIPAEGTGTGSIGGGMFMQTGGTFTGTPSINTTYYLWDETAVKLITQADENILTTTNEELEANL